MDSNKLAIPLAIIVAGGLMAGALYFSNMQATKQAAKVQPAQAGTETVTGEPRPVTKDDHILGNPNADVVIIEYSDTGCPFCKLFHPTLQRIIDEYGKDGRVAWVYRHFPIDQLHPKSRKQAEATECANEQGGDAKFWSYLNMVYQKTPSSGSLEETELPKIAKEIGLDVNKFNECLSSGRFSSKVQADYDDGVKAGTRGTPHSILITKDGVKTPISGAASYESLKSTIDALLAK
jgi:protein-disulfide isomerase